MHRRPAEKRRFKYRLQRALEMAPPAARYDMAAANHKFDLEHHLDPTGPIVTIGDDGVRTTWGIPEQVPRTERAYPRYSIAREPWSILALILVVMLGISILSCSFKICKNAIGRKKQTLRRNATAGPASGSSEPPGRRHSADHGLADIELAHLPPHLKNNVQYGENASYYDYVGPAASTPADQGVAYDNNHNNHSYNHHHGHNGHHSH